MRTQVMLAALMASAAAGPAAFAQQATDRGGIPTETQERLDRGDTTTDALNLLGLLGLLGLAGLRKGHDEDGYHPAPLE